MYLLVRRSVESAVHGTNAGNQTETGHSPRVGSHQTERPAVGVQRSRGNCNDTDSQTGVQESVIQVAPFVRRHSAILSRFAVEDQVRSDDCSSDDGSSVEQSLSKVATLGDAVSGLHVRPAESILESLSRAAEDGRWRRCRCLGS